ncbi:unnamed protein product [Meganyctiphanes norvegica]|uniref:Uncharacterized protein n=1 Tax=Meganyctiphanes norvegica TaxID=48144 RepID=A0AAV2QY67_MEGNR
MHCGCLHLHHQIRSHHCYRQSINQLSLVELLVLDWSGFDVLSGQQVEMCDKEDNNQESVSSTVSEEPLLGSQQADIDLLAAEIAEAATEEERRSRTPSPGPEYRSQDQQSRLQSQDDVEDVDKGLRDKKEVEEEGEDDDDSSSSSSESSDPAMDMSIIQESPSNRAIDDSVLELSVIEDEETSSKDVDDGVLELSMILQQEDMDEASWVMVDADAEDLSIHTDNDAITESENAAKLKCVFRKFLGSHEMSDKMLELGLTCDNAQESSSQQIEMSDSGMENSETFLKTLEETPKITIWKGEFAGAKVCVEGESKGGLLVADVRLWHTDLLQALTALKNLANKAGLISYADVDVSSLLARAA